MIEVQFQSVTGGKHSRSPHIYTSSNLLLSYLFFPPIVTWLSQSPECIAINPCHTGARYSKNIQVQVIIKLKL